MYGTIFMEDYKIKKKGKEGNKIEHPAFPWMKDLQQSSSYQK